jgi:hypothetical protein
VQKPSRWLGQSLQAPPPASSEVATLRMPCNPQNRETDASLSVRLHQAVTGRRRDKTQSRRSYLHLQQAPLPASLRSPYSK